MAVPTDGYIQPPSNVAGSSNKVGTNVITDSSGNTVQLQKINLSDPLLDQQASIDASGALAVAPTGNAFGTSDSTRMIRILEQILVELQTINLNFANANFSPTVVAESSANTQIITPTQ